MDEDSLRRDLTAALLDIERIDSEIQALQHRRVLIEEFATSCRNLLDPSNTTSHYGGGRSYPAPGSNEQSAKAWPERPRKGSSLSEARIFWGRVVFEAISIIREVGEPLPAAEIHARHSLRQTLTPEDIYDALYKRARRGNYVESLGGRFRPL